MGLGVGLTVIKVVVPVTVLEDVTCGEDVIVPVGVIVGVRVGVKVIVDVDVLVAVGGTGEPVARYAAVNCASRVWT